MVFLMFVDTEGIRLDEMEFTMYNFTLLSNQSVLIAFYNSLKYSLLTTLLCIFSVICWRIRFLNRTLKTNI